MIAQELLDALNKAQNEADLDPVAVWALSKYLHGAWKDQSDKNIRPFELGRILSNFYVDLTHQRLPEVITKQTPETEALLLKFFGGDEGSLSHFWKQCIGIWSVTLEGSPAFAKEVKAYFDMLLQSSKEEKPSKASARADKAPTQPPIETPPPGRPRSRKPSDQATIVIPSRQLKEAEPASAPPEPLEQSGPTVFPKSAYLILQGTRVIPLNQPFIMVGRQLDNHIILEDPRVSRYHAQIKLINDRFVIFDMHSTGGTFVNGRRTTQSVLYPGDVITLAGVKFIYSQEMPAKPGEVNIIELGSPFAADRPTAVMRKEEIKPIDKAALKEMPKTGPLE